MGYDVAINDPYKGVELVRKRGRPRERRHSLQIEMNRRLYMDERRSTSTAGFVDLQRNLRAASRRVSSTTFVASPRLTQLRWICA